MEIPASSAEIDVPSRLIDQVLGQERAVEVVRLAARQGRFLLIVGEPGTGKSLLGQAVAELLPAENLEEIVAWHNPDDPMLPRIARHPAGTAEELVKAAKREARSRSASERYLYGVAIATVLLISLYYSIKLENAFYLLLGACVILALRVFNRFIVTHPRASIPKVLVENKLGASAPFIDATGSQAGALLGDVRHDPYQSGGSETPPHELLEAGAVHRAHRGVLFIDEVATLSMESQQSLLSAIQAKELSITGRSPGSSGTMVRSSPVPCDFLLVLAGNVEDIDKMHPALRSRIRGYGYEIFTQSVMQDSVENRRKLAQFVAQEVRRDGRIPHFSREGIEAIIEHARERAAAAGMLSARFRELGGIVRIAGDLARQDGATLVGAEHVKRAKPLALSLEEQARNSAASAANPVLVRNLSKEESVETWTVSH